MKTRTHTGHRHHTYPKRKRMRLGTLAIPLPATPVPGRLVGRSRHSRLSDKLASARSCSHRSRPPTVLPRSHIFTAGACTFPLSCLRTQPARACATRHPPPPASPRAASTPGNTGAARPLQCILPERQAAGIAREKIPGAANGARHAAWAPRRSPPPRRMQLSIGRSELSKTCTCFFLRVFLCHRHPSLRTSSPAGAAQRGSACLTKAWVLDACAGGTRRLCRRAWPWL